MQFQNISTLYGKVFIKIISSTISWKIWMAYIKELLLCVCVATEEVLFCVCLCSYRGGPLLYASTKKVLLYLQLPRLCTATEEVLSHATTKEALLCLQSLKPLLFALGCIQAPMAHLWAHICPSEINNSHCLMFMVSQEVPNWYMQHGSQPKSGN